MDVGVQVEDVGVLHGQRASPCTCWSHWGADERSSFTLVGALPEGVRSMADRDILPPLKTFHMGDPLPPGSSRVWEGEQLYGRYSRLGW